MRKERIQYTFRLLLSLGIIVALFWIIDLDDFPRLSEVKVTYVVFALIMVFIDRLLNAYKWGFLVGAAGLKVRFVEILKIYFVSGFIGIVLPSSVGGELLKGYGLARVTSEAIDSASSVIVDRITGLLALTGLCVIGYYMSPVSLREMPSIIILKNISILIFVITVGIIVAGFSLPNWYFDMSERRGPISTWVEKVWKSFYQYQGKNGALVAALSVSLAIHVLRVFTVWTAGLAVGVHLYILYFVIFVPFIQLGGIVPLTIAGVGVKEGAAVYLFSLAGMGAATALAMYLVVRILAIVSVLPGGWIYFKRGFVSESSDDSLEGFVEEAA